MGSRLRPTRIQCVNCNVCVNNIRRYSALELDTRVVTLLISWVQPLIITENDVVCEGCRDAAFGVINQNLQLDVNEQASSTRERRHTPVCFLCGCSTLHRQSDRILRDNPSELHQAMIDIIRNKVAPRQVTASDQVCHACWLRIQREARRVNVIDDARSQSVVGPTEDTQEEEVHAEPENSQSVVLSEYRRAANCSSHCVFPRCTSTSLRSISDKLRAIVISDHNYYLPKLARVCSVHLMSNTWDTLYSSGNSFETFTVDQIQHIFSFVNKFNKTLDFENLSEMDNHVFEYWIGFTKENFNAILEEVPRVRNTQRGSMGLAALLIKMRTGDSDERISSLINIPRRSLEKLMNNVRDILLEDFVPINLGTESINREQLLQHNLTIPNGLYGNGENAIVICDGTYIYIKKSANYMFQKDSYSLHKYRNLLKPFLMVACDGYIVDCFGPYKATTSDATIMSKLFCDGSPLRSYFRENDVFIVDRGFRDSVSLLEGCGYKVCIPETLLPGEHQLTTVQANKSRCVTICRWVVEAVNGHFKRDYKIFRQEYIHRSIPNMMNMFKIASAFLNRFGVRFRDNIYAAEIVEIIKERINFDNNLANMVSAMNLNRRTSHFQSITADQNNVLYFPTMEYRDLILFALGTYHIRQARSYYGEHVRSQGGYIIEINSEQFNSTEYRLRGNGERTLLRGRIKSRHIARKKYYVYILIENNIPGRTGILEYCCSCLVGKRTVGCCAHTMTIVWYLGWARHGNNISAPAEFLDSIFIRDDEYDE